MSPVHLSSRRENRAGQEGSTSKQTFNISKDSA